VQWLEAEEGAAVTSLEIVEEFARLSVPDLCSFAPRRLASLRVDEAREIRELLRATRAVKLTRRFRLHHRWSPEGERYREAKKPCRRCGEKKRYRSDGSCVRCQRAGVRRRMSA
jgi:hypothetical protein